MKTKIVTQVRVRGEVKSRRVFYVRRAMLFDEHGRVCQTPLELGASLAVALNGRDKEAVGTFCWDALNFVHDGKVPKNWSPVWHQAHPTPLAI